MPSYFQLVARALTDLNDVNQQSLSDGFKRELCEVCLCVLMLHTKAQTAIKSVVFPSGTALPGIDFVPVLDIYKQSDLLYQVPEMMLPLAVRNLSGVELSKASANILEYFDDAWTAIATNALPIEYYIIASNLLGIRKLPEVDMALTILYVPYVEIVNITDDFPLDLSYESRMIRLLRAFLLVRLSNFDTAKEELKRFTADD